MSEPLAPQPLADVTEVTGLGMITFRGDLSDPAVTEALQAIGLGLPPQRGILQAEGRAIGWMSPDELLLILPHPALAAALASLNGALAGHHHLAVDVSDARAVFRLEGPHAREVLARIAPVDLSPEAFKPGELRRSRAAQVPAAFWLGGDGAFTLICFRSVAGYVGDILRSSAAAGRPAGIF